MTPDVTIIIPSFNTRELLKSCLASLDRARGSLHLEIIVVDNGSTDGTSEMIRAQFPSVRTICNAENRRWAGANNQGIEASGGRYLLFLNSDTEVSHGALTLMAGHLDAHPEVDVIGPRLHNTDGSLQRSCRALPDPLNVFSEAFFLFKLFPSSDIFGRYHMTNFDHRSARTVEMVSGAAFLVRRAAVDEVGGFDENFFFYGEETDYFRRLQSAGRITMFLPQAIVVHHGTSSPQVRYEYFLNLHRGLIGYFRKYFRGMPLYLMLLFKYAGNILRSPVYLVSGLLTLDGDRIRKSWYYLRVLFG